MKIYQFLIEELPASKQEISAFLLSAPNKYKIYTIPKRSSGYRVIAHPSKKLKIYQKKLVKLLEEFLPIHDAAFAYRRGIGIKHNARYHSQSNYLLKMDFMNFFNSISPEMLLNLIEKKGIELDKSDPFLLRQTLFCNLRKQVGGKLFLSVGAPSSPFVSNAIMYSFDNILTSICKERKIFYSRYADDLTFSTKVKGALFDIPSIVKSVLFEEFAGGVTVNESKTVFSSKAHNRHVTGVTITNDNELSIGRKRKRYIASLIHKYTISELPEEDVEHLRGLLAFASDIESTFTEKMIKKYSREVIESIVNKK